MRSADDALLWNVWLADGAIYDVVSIDSLHSDCCHITAVVGCLVSQRAECCCGI